MLKKLKILLMDGEKDSSKEIQEFLDKEGFIVLPAYSAAAGKLVLQKMTIDILILDIQLPDANGLDLLVEYKSKYPKMEVIIISGYGDVSSVIQAMHQGVLDFLRKPLRQMEILGAIERSQKFHFPDNSIFLSHEKVPVRTVHL